MTPIEDQGASGEVKAAFRDVAVPRRANAVHRDLSAAAGYSDELDPVVGFSGRLLAGRVPPYALGRRILRRVS